MNNKRFNLILYALTACFGIFLSLAQAPAGRKAWYGNPATDVRMNEAIYRRNYYIVLDGSGSMREAACRGTASKADTSKLALGKFIRKIPATDNVGLLVFDSLGVTERVPLGINNRAELYKAVQDARADSGTPLRSAIGLAYERLKLQGQKQLGYGEYNLVIVTDGEANPGEDPSVIVSVILGESPVIIHTMGFCIGPHHSLNQPGRTIYKEASDLDSLSKGLESVLAESEKFVPITSFKK